MHRRSALRHGPIFVRFCSEKQKPGANEMPIEWEILFSRNE